MEGKGAVVFLPREDGRFNWMLEELMFAPPAVWMAEALRAEGFEKFLVVCHDDDRQAAQACFPEGTGYVTTGATDARERLAEFLSGLTGRVAVVTQPVYLNAAAAAYLADDGAALPRGESCGVFRVDSAALKDALDAGADSVSLIRSDALAAIGAGLEVARPEASFVIEAGAGGIGAALLSFGRTVVSRQMPIGFAGVDGEIVGAMRAKGVRIGEDAAEGAKLALASASGASSGKLSVSTAGFDEKTRLPRLVDIEADLVNALVAPYVRTLTSLCVDALAQAPIELAADLAARGACLVGGGAELFGLREHLAGALGIDVFVPDNPRDAVARGLSAAIEADGAYDRLILESDRADLQ